MMSYEALLTIYPWIGELFAAVQSTVRAGATPDMAMYRLYRRINRDVMKQDRTAVTNKLIEFASLVAQNRVRRSIPQPSFCPTCHSIDTNSGMCDWCRTPIGR